MRYILIALTLTLVSCGTSGTKEVIKYDGNGNVTERTMEVGSDIAAMQLQVADTALRVELMRAAAQLEPHAQTAMTARGEIFDMPIESYIAGENVEAQTTANGFTAGVHGILGLGALKVLGDAVKNQTGDSTTNVSGLNITKSDDPSAGEGGTTGRVGGQSIVIGGGSAGTDQALLNSPSDKLINTPNPVSSFDGSGNPSGILLQDDDDVRNEVGLIP